MTNWLKQLYAQQTTPDEVVVFLLLGTLVTLIIAMLFYSVIVLVLSSWRMREGVSAWGVLFPSARRMKNYAGEYTLGTVTAILLAFTVAAKQDAVQVILDQNISAIGSETIKSALPKGGLDVASLTQAGADPDAAQNLVDWLEDEPTASISRRAEEIIRPLLASGMAESASLVVREAVRAFDPYAKFKLSQDVIFAFAIGLLLGYVTWFGVQRWQEVRKSNDAEPNYAFIVKRLALPAVCIPLLLVSASAMESSERLANSVIGYVDSTDVEQELPLSLAIKDQIRDFRDAENRVNVEDLEAVSSLLAAMESRVATLSDRIDSSSASMSQLSGRLNNLDGNITAVRGRLSNLDSSLNSLTQQLRNAEQQSKLNADNALRIAEIANTTSKLATEQIAETQADLERLQQSFTRLARQVAAGTKEEGLLYVYSGRGRFLVRRGSSNASPVEDDFTTGLYELTPGTYFVNSGGITRQVVVRADSASFVYIPPPSTIQ